MSLRVPLLIKGMDRTSFERYFKLNQDVTASFETTEIVPGSGSETTVAVIESNQDTSTPGIISKHTVTLEPNKVYEFIVRAQADDGVTAFLWVQNKDNKVRIMDPTKRYCTDNGQMSLVSTLITVGNKSINANFGILFSDPSDGDKFWFDTMILQERQGLGVFGNWRMVEVRNALRIDVFDSDPRRNDWVPVQTLIKPAICE